MRYLDFTWGIFLISWGYISTISRIFGNPTMRMKTLNITVVTSLYSCRLFSLCPSLTVNLQKVPQILATHSEIDQILFTTVYGRLIYNSSSLFLIIQFTVLVSIVTTTIIYIQRPNDFSLLGCYEVLFRVLSYFDFTFRESTYTVLLFISIILLVNYTL